MTEKKPKTIQELKINDDRQINKLFEKFLTMIAAIEREAGVSTQIDFKTYIEELDKLDRRHTAFKDKVVGIKKAIQSLAKEEKLTTEQTLALYQKVITLNKSKITQQRIFKELEKEILDLEQERNTTYGKQGKALDSQKKAYKEIVGIVKDLYKYSEEIYKISHELQLQGNLTWKEYSKYYHETFESARDINTELSKSIFNSKQLLNIQKEMIGQGWKGLSAANISSLSSSIALMQKTLGAFPIELQTAFQKSYRIFGDQTSSYIEDMGDRLNTLQTTFGSSIAMMTTLISQMTSSNNFITRTNYEMAVKANESLLAAAALSAEVGLTSTNFLAQLSGVAQFGTATEQASIYSGGALLQGFNTQQFMAQLQSQQYNEATQSLFSSIAQTMEGLGDNQLLRAEYMKQIQAAFGLSRDDILQITMGGDKLGELSNTIANKLASSEKSMVDELKGLNVSMSERFENWWLNTRFSETFSKVSQDIGMYGMGAKLDSIRLILLGMYSLSAKEAGVGMLDPLKGLFIKSPTQATATTANAANLGGLTSFGKFASVAGGAALGTATNIYGHNLIAQDKSQVGGWLANTLGGTAGGALMGAPFGLVGAGVGAGIGLTTGIINSIIAESSRQSALDAYEKNMRERRRQERLAEDRAMLSQRVETGNPVVDAINEMGDRVVGAIVGEGKATRDMQFTSDMIRRGKIEEL